MTQLLKDEQITQSVAQKIIAQDILGMVHSLVECLSDLSFFEECLSFLVQFKSIGPLPSDLIPLISAKMKSFEIEDLSEIKRLLSLLS